MQKIFISTVIILTVLAAGCLGIENLSWSNKSIPIINIIIKKLSTSEGRAIKLTESQRRLVLNCLRGFGKKGFCSPNLKEDIWSYWYEVNGIVHKDKVFLVRYTLDDEAFKLISIDSNGDVFSVCGGKRGSICIKKIDEGPIL